MPTVVAVGTSIPEFIATNDYVVSLVIEKSRNLYKGDLSQLENNVRAFLNKAGSDRRRWRSAALRPLDHIDDAWQNCLGRVDSRAQREIGALIYCGIDKGVAEPSHASLLAKRFGLSNARTLDVSDACMGWLTAAQVSSSLPTVGGRYCAIISAEFPIEMPGKVYPEALIMRNEADLLWKGAALTLGECASVTLIDAGSVEGHACVFRSNNGFSDLCCVPLARPERFLDFQPLLDRLADDCFVANAGKMASVSYRDAQDVLRTYISRYGLPDVVLPHTVSQTGPHYASRNIVPDGTIQNCFNIFGNISTSSIPVGYEYFQCAHKQNAHVAGWISAAGMSHAAFRIQ